MPGLLSRALVALGFKSDEGAYREGPYDLPVSGGFLPAGAGSYANWWQLGYNVEGTTGNSAIIQACVSAYAQTAAMCPGSHWRTKGDGSRERVTNSSLSRILRQPNVYQSPSDFVLNLTSALYRTGNAYALAVRNDRFEIVELHLMTAPHCGARVAVTGDVFYSLGGNPVIEQQMLSRGMNQSLLSAVPARDVLHVRLETPRHPLLGETPLASAMLDVAASNAMVRQMLAFYDRQARPSGTLNTDKDLTAQQVSDLRERWDEQSRGLNAGGTPILANGLKWTPMSVPSKDSQFAEVMKMTDQNIALTFRVPLQILGIGDTPFASTESLMGSWLSSGLGFAVNHIEQAYDRLFGLAGAPMEYVELDTSVLLRSDFAGRVAGWAAGVNGGIFARNEARADFELGPVKGGNEPWVQQQDLPLSVAAEMAAEDKITNPEPTNSTSPQGEADAERRYDGSRRSIEQRRQHHSRLH